MLADTVNAVLTGRLDPKVGNCVSILSGNLLKALESGEIEQRLDSIEQKLNGG